VNAEPGLSLIAVLGLLAMLAVLMWALVAVLTSGEREGIEWEDGPSDNDLWLDGDPEWPWPSQDKEAAATLQRPAA